MMRWIKNLYKGDNSMSFPITLVIAFIAYWFISKAIKYQIATPFVLSKHVYDFILPFIITFIIFRFIYVKTQPLHENIFLKTNFLWFIVKVTWAISILVSWNYVSFYLPKITTNIIYKATDLPKYVIDPCGYWSADDYWNSTYTNWTKEEESEALKFWNYERSRGFYYKCKSQERDTSDNVMSF